MSAAFRPFVNTFNYMVGACARRAYIQRQSAHERPIVFYSLVVGFFGRSACTYAGPAAVIVVPRVRASYGWKPAERIPITYPCMLAVCAYAVPGRKRTPVSGYDDE